MIKISVKEVARLAAILGLILATPLLLPEALRAQSAHEGKFSAAANGRARIYTNATTATQKVLVTVCVTTAGPQTADVTARDAAGALVDSLAGVRFGQCRSVTAELASDNHIAVGASVAVAGNYTLSILP
ncbi:MAG TPA: hypothetical protein VGL70_15175 [Candidatus Binatia bacterium]|jgi:hypothetical protein